MKTLQIKFLGKDKHYRDVYGTEYGAILKNIELEFENINIDIIKIAKQLSGLRSLRIRSLNL